MGRRISIANKLAMIAAGYGRAVGGGIMAGAVNKLLFPDHIQQTSPGKVEDPLRSSFGGTGTKIIERFFAEGKSRVVPAPLAGAKPAGDSDQDVSWALGRTRKTPSRSLRRENRVAPD